VRGVAPARPPLFVGNALDNCFLSLIIYKTPTQGFTMQDKIEIITQALFNSDIVWSRYGSDTILKLAERIVEKLDTADNNSLSRNSAKLQFHERYANDNWCFLDGEPAKIDGLLWDFPLVSQNNSALRVSFCWETVVRIMDCDRHFKS